MMMQLFRRQRLQRRPNGERSQHSSLLPINRTDNGRDSGGPVTSIASTILQEDPSSSRSEDDPSSFAVEAASRERLVMAIHHMTAFVLIFYGLCLVCRFGFGWDPMKDPPPTSYTIEIPGLTTKMTTTTTTRITIDE